MRIREIEVLGEFRVKLTLRWPKSTLVKLVVETLDQIQKIAAARFHTCGERRDSKWSNQSDKEREMCEDEMSEMSSNCDLIYIH